MEYTDIEDLRKAAKRRLPAIIYDYIAGGGYEKETLRRNRRDLESLALIPRVLNDISERNIGVQIAGQNARLPLVLAPVGACGLSYPNAEVHAAKAALSYSVPFCLSTLSIATIEDVAQATKAPFWFQLYITRDRGVSSGLVQRAFDAGCSVLVLSMDLHVRSQRHGEQKHGLVAPPRVDIPNVWDGLIHPRWLFSMIHSKHRTFGNLVGLVKDAKNVSKITEWLEDQFDPTLSPKDIEWAKSVWSRKIFVKGVMHPDDAKLCADLGVDGIIVSNHGGRQVDGAVSTVSVLPNIVEAVEGRVQVLADSGVRTGIDILKMMASGASGCLIGRAYMYGLGAAGEKGVCRALEILEKELDQNMALCGIKDIRDLPPDLLVADQFLVDWERRNKGQRISFL